MPTSRRHGALVAVCAVVLATFVFASIAAWMGHTDDGCAVEFHCFACVWALGATADITLPPCPPPAIHVVGRVRAAAVIKPMARPAPDVSSRAPPSV